MFLAILFLHVILYVEAVDIQQEFSRRFHNNYSPRPFKSCFENLGCLDTTEHWYHETKRPVNLEPLDRHTIRTEFIYIKSSNGTGEMIYDTMAAKKSSIEVAGFQNAGDTMFLIHDFTSNGYTGWIKHMARVVSKNVSNLISVDWEAGAEPPFQQAIANARVVSLEIIEFMNVLKQNFGVESKSIHLIGHGVGAHIAGYVGHAIKGIKRITALDPTGPYFQGMPDEVRLHHGDANYVEVLHTDSFNGRSQGSMESMGHIDFYINNAGLQPGCNATNSYPLFTKLDRDSLKEGEILPACSHKRSFKYFIEALENRDCNFLGLQCDSYEDFVDGKCTTCELRNNKTTCAVMGLETPYVNVGSRFYFNTRSEYPFCMHTYLVNINVSASSKTQTGTFEMIFIGDNNELANISIGDVGHKPVKYEAGKGHTSVFYASSPKITVIKEAKVKWIHKPNPLCVMYCNMDIIVDRITVKYVSKSENSGVENKLCPTSVNHRISNGEYLLFESCDVLKTTLPTESSIRTDATTGTYLKSIV